MSITDRDLGMNRKIRRRDFINGVSAAAAGALLPNWGLAQEFAPERAPDYYPPALTGMRGSHPGSFEVAHALRDSRSVDLSSVSHTNETYDLVVVGGGISGLSAAYFFLKNAGRSARVLILDNHDDFGGHAKRNEFRYNGKLMAINGGTLNIEAPQRYFEDAKGLFRDIGIDLDRFQTSNASTASFIARSAWVTLTSSTRRHGGRISWWSARRRVVAADTPPRFWQRHRFRHKPRRT
jgi:spermidine dehydrogenase